MTRKRTFNETESQLTDRLRQPLQMEGNDFEDDLAEVTKDKDINLSNTVPNCYKRQ